MVEIIAGTLLAFFAIIGAAELFRSFCGYLLEPKLKKTAYIVTSCGNEDQIEYIIRSLVSKSESLNTVCKTRCIIIIDKGMEDEAKKICALLSEDTSGFIKVCGANELQSALNGDFQN